MHVLLDHLTAVIVGGFVVIILLSALTLRSTESQETTRTYITQQSLASFTEVLEADLENMGMQMPAGVSIIVTYTPENLTFWGLDGPEGNIAQIGYTRTSVGTRDSLTLYRVDRFVNGVASGSIEGEVTQFELTLLDNRSQTLPESSWDEVRQVRLSVERLTAYTPSDERAAREAMRSQGWESTVRLLAQE